MRTAVHFGEKGMLEGDVASVRRCTSTMTRAYETALKRSLGISLTKWHCEIIDEKSHEIELLRPRLEKRIVELSHRNGSAAGRCALKANHDLTREVPLFLDHCMEFRENAEIMRKMNAELMRRSDFRRMSSQFCAT